MSEHEIEKRIVQAYDSMSLQRWASFEAYCENNQKLTSLLSFIEYLLSCAERCEAIDRRPEE